MIRVIKRKGITRKQKVLYSAYSIAGAFLLVSLYILSLGANPIQVLGSLLEGSLGSKFRILSTLKTAIPLFIVATGIGFAFKMKFWNIGAEGQMMMGAIFATFFALNFPHMPKIPLLLIMMIAGVIGGGLVGGLSGFIKVRLNTNETIITLMLNYVILLFLTYLQYELWKDPGSLGFPKIAAFTDNAILPKVFGLHIGWIFAIIIAITSHFIFNKSRIGYELSVLGESSKTAVYAGIDIKRLTLLITFISGGLAGLAGMIQASGVMNTLSIEVTMGFGYTAIIIAWLGKLEPNRIFIVSVLFAILTQGGCYIQSAQGISATSIGVLQATILFIALGREFFNEYKFVLRKGVE